MYSFYYLTVHLLFSHAIPTPIVNHLGVAHEANQVPGVALATLATPLAPPLTLGKKLCFTLKRLRLFLALAIEAFSLLLPKPTGCIGGRVYYKISSSAWGTGEEIHYCFKIYDDQKAHQNKRGRTERERERAEEKQ